MFNFLTVTELGDVRARQSPSLRITIVSKRKDFVLGDIHSRFPHKLKNIRNSRGKSIPISLLKPPLDIKHIGRVNLSRVNNINKFLLLFFFTLFAVGFEDDLGISVVVIDLGGVSSRRSGDGNGVSSQHFVDSRDEGGPEGFNFSLNLVLGGVGLGRGHGGDVNHKVIGVEGEVQLSVAVEEEGQVGSFNRSDSDLEGEFGKGNVGEEGDHGRLVSGGRGKVDVRGMGEVELDLEAILLGIKLEILKVLGNGKEDVVDKRVSSLKGHHLVLNEVGSDRERVVGEVRGLRRANNDVEDSLSAEAVLVASSPLSKTPINTQRNGPREGDVVGELNVVDDGAKNVGEESVEEDVDERHGAIQQSLQQKADTVLLDIKVEVELLERHLKVAVLSSSNNNVKVGVGADPKSSITTTGEHLLASPKAPRFAELVGESDIKVNVQGHLGALFPLGNRNRRSNRVRGNGHVGQIQPFMALRTITTILRERRPQSGQGSISHRGDNLVKNIGKKLSGKSTTKVGVFGTRGSTDLDLLGPRGTHQETTQKQEAQRGGHVVGGNGITKKRKKAAGKNRKARLGRYLET